jgi:hypothetical protein
MPNDAVNKISFSIEINSKTCNGYLSSTDVLDPPKVFFVFLENYIVGELMYRDKWIFEQGNRYKILGKLNTGQCDYIANYLGNN